MTVPSYASTIDEPLISDYDVLRRVEKLIGRANLRQLWLLFLDDQNVQLPLLVPIDALPVMPDEHAMPGLAESMRMVMTEIGATSLIVVIERYASSSLSAQDVAWAVSIRQAFSDGQLELRALLLSHRAGVRMLTERELASWADLGSVRGA